MQPVLTPQEPSVRVRAYPSSHRFAPRALNIAQEVSPHLSLLLLPPNVLSLMQSCTPCTRHGIAPEYSGCSASKLGHKKWLGPTDLHSKCLTSSPCTTTMLPCSKQSKSKGCCSGHLWISGMTPGLWMGRERTDSTPDLRKSCDFCLGPGAGRGCFPAWTWGLECMGSTMDLGQAAWTIAAPPQNHSPPPLSSYL